MEIITENKNFHFNTIINNLSANNLAKGLNLNELNSLANIYKILDEEKKVIGYASLYDEGTGLLVEGFIRYDIPERLSIETDGLFLNIHFSNNIVDHLSIDSSSSECGVKITGDNQITIEE
jgi:hypothetical protein